MITLRSWPHRRDGRFAERDGVVVARDISLDTAIQVLVLQKDNRIVVADRRLQQSLGVVGCGGFNDLEARRVYVGHLRVLGVKRAAAKAASRGGANDQRHGPSPAEAALGGKVRDLVERAGHEIRELHFDDRPQAVDGCPCSGPHDGRLRQRCVDHSPLAEALQKTLRYLEGAAVDGDVLAHDEDGLVTLHFFPKALANRFHVGHLSHVFPRASPAGADTKPACQIFS